MTLVQLKYFTTVCQYGSVTCAAEVLHVSQPSVSSAIRDLEEQFQVNLFHRVNKKMILTEEGHTLWTKAAIILEQTTTLEAMMQDFGGCRKNICLGVPPMIGTMLFPAMFDEFHEVYPDINVSITEHGSRKIRELICGEKLDVAIAIADKEKDKEFHVLPLHKTRLQFCVSKSHKFHLYKVLNLSELDGERLIFFKEDSIQKELLTRKFTALRIEPNIVLESEQLYTIIKMVEKGIAGAFLFHEIAKAEPGIVGIELEEPIAMDICLIWKKDRYIYGDTVKLIQFMKNRNTEISE